MARCNIVLPRRPPPTPSSDSSDNAELHTYLASDDLMRQYDSYLKFYDARMREKRRKLKGRFFFPTEHERRMNRIRPKNEAVIETKRKSL